MHCPSCRFTPLRRATAFYLESIHAECAGGLSAHRGGKRFVVHADEKLSAFIELERQVLTVTFYLGAVIRVYDDEGSATKHEHKGEFKE
jgi:hypothetical protein